MRLTMRSKIALRWTTCPADLGYDGCKTSWMTDTPEIVSSPRRVLAAAYNVQKNVGMGTYIAFSFRWRGAEISREEIEESVGDAMWMDS